MFKKLKLFKRDKSQKESSAGDNLPDLFRFKYSCFKMLLDSNAEFLNVLTDLEEKLRGQQVFGMAYVRSRSAKAVFHALRMIKNIDDLSGHCYSPLFDILEKINLKIKEILGREKRNFHLRINITLLCDKCGDDGLGGRKKCQSGRDTQHDRDSDPLRICNNHKGI